MGLPEVWFIIVAVLWTGFFFLEGFDFGVGMLARTLGANEDERSQMLAAIGPVWDADEVWLVTGGIAIFAAFPAWYAALFPAAYLPLLLVIIAIIVRAVAIEYRSKRPGPRWRSRWDTSVAVASLLLAFLFGVFWGGIVHGIPLTADGTFVGDSLMSFINLYSLLTGVTLLLFSLAHGATFLALKTTGAVRAKNEAWARRFDVVAGAFMTVFAVWTYWAFSRGDVLGLVVGLIAVVAMAVALLANSRVRPLIAFWGHGVAIAAFVAQMFIALYPNVLPSTVDPADSLTVQGSAASEYSLTIITVVAAIALPMVIAYQAWSFWVFRKRITVEDATRAYH
ncbi:MAG: cytochrome d ubiquinol oxidase subunit II [Actinomycetales bacterium]|nr:cytochrome d ubiquinol oxidase subunit II [Actinomycetales bacterium]